MVRTFASSLACMLLGGCLLREAPTPGRTPEAQRAELRLNAEQGFGFVGDWVASELCPIRSSPPPAGWAVPLFPTFVVVDPGNTGLEAGQIFSVPRRNQTPSEPLETRVLTFFRDLNEELDTDCGPMRVALHGDFGFYDEYSFSFPDVTLEEAAEIVRATPKTSEELTSVDLFSGGGAE